MADQVFYIAEAHVFAVEGPHQYTLWFLDHHNDQSVDAWRNGTYDPKGEVVTGVRLDYTADTATPHVLDRKVSVNADPLVARLLDDPIGNARRGRLAVHSDVWNRIPLGKRPLPSKRDEAYRLELVRVDATTSYLGVHAQILDIAQGEQRIAFYSWQNKLVSDHWVDPVRWSDGTFSSRSKLGTASKIGEAGAVYVKTTELSTFGLSIPKVPWGTGE